MQEGKVVEIVQSGSFVKIAVVLLIEGALSYGMYLGISALLF